MSSCPDRPTPVSPERFPVRVRRCAFLDSCDALPPALRTPTTNAGAPIDMGAALRPENRLVEVALLRYNGGCTHRRGVGVCVCEL